MINNNYDPNYNYPSQNLPQFSETKFTLFSKVALAAIPIISFYVFDIQTAVDSNMGESFWFANTVLSGYAGYYLTKGALTAAHESFHALCAKIFYKNSNPKIHFNWFKNGGATSMDLSELTSLGKKIDYPTCSGITAAAGPIAEATILIGASLWGPNTTYLKLPLLIHSLNALNYASNFFSETPSMTEITIDGNTFQEPDSENDYVIVNHHGGWKAFVALSTYILAAVYFCFTSVQNILSQEQGLFSHV